MKAVKGDFPAYEINEVEESTSELKQKNLTVQVIKFVKLYEWAKAGQTGMLGRLLKKQDVWSL